MGEEHEYTLRHSLDANKVIQPGDVGRVRASLKHQSGSNKDARGGEI